jgi:hypothetical protein
MRPRFTLTLIAVLFAFTPLHAELVTLDIHKQEPYLGGKEFGEVGAYELLTGVAIFHVDPLHPRNQAIVDLHLAPKNAAGMVEFQSDAVILKPVDPTKMNGAILYDVNNRGNKLALRMFNNAKGGNDLGDKSDAGDGFLFRRGYTVVWCGWIGELLPGDQRLLLKAPVVKENGQPARGIVRYEMVTDTPAETLPLSRRENHGSYSPTAEGEKTGVLTWRARESDERQPVPRDQWTLERLPIPKVDNTVPGTLGQIRMRLKGGFKPGHIYELVCESEGPIVQGLGCAAVRDLLSFLRYNTARDNPLAFRQVPFIKRVHGFGVSQSGRFLRHFVYQGFNADEKDRIVFDGLMPHVAGGGLGFFNHRFAQPTRHNAQHEEHLYPADIFPFTYGDMEDPLTNKTDGIQRRLARELPACLPKIMHTQSAAEYWHRSGSLVHTDPLGKGDAEIPPNVRIYAFGGTQHGPASDPPKKGIADNLNNPGDYRPHLRALLDALDAWVKDGTAPPPSVYPRIDQATLVDWHQEITGFPAIPGIRYPQVIQRPQATDFGPQFLSRGLITFEPPKIRGDYVVLVPKSGPDGNDLGTLLPPEVAVPLATYTGWNLRSKDVGADGALASLIGSYIPFPRTAEERKSTGDPRLSIRERYTELGGYKERFAAKCSELVRQRYLLAEDAERLNAGRSEYWKRTMGE